MIIDGLLLIIGAYAFFTGYSRGIINTFFYVFSWFVAAVATLKFARPAQDLITIFYNGDPKMTYMLGLVAAFLVSLLGVRYVGRLFTDVMENANINLINQVLGGALSAGFFVMLFSYVVQFFDRANLITPALKQESKTWFIVEKSPEYSTKFIATVTPFISDLWKETLSAMDGVSKSSIEHTESAPQIYDQELPEETTPAQ